MTQFPKVTGVFRIADNTRILSVSFVTPPTDDDLRRFHDYIREAVDTRWKRCPSTHCERREECASPNDCIVKKAVSQELIRSEAKKHPNAINLKGRGF